MTDKLITLHLVHRRDHMMFYYDDPYAAGVKGDWVYLDRRWNRNTDFGDFNGYYRGHHYNNDPQYPDTFSSRKVQL